MRAFVALAALLFLTSAKALGRLAMTYPDLSLPVFTQAQLEAPDAVTRATLEAAVRDIGMFAVTGFDGAGADAVATDVRAFHGAIDELVRCHTHGPVPLDALYTSELDDGTLRRTIAVATDASARAPLPGDVAATCPAFARAAAALRASVDRVGRAYSKVLDDLVYHDTATPPAPGGYRDAVLNAESLEHFHVFTCPDGAQCAARAGGVDDPAAVLAAPTLSMHTDVGAFLVMTHAEYYRVAAGGGAAQPARLDPGWLGTPRLGLLMELEQPHAPRRRHRRAAAAAQRPRRRPPLPTRRAARHERRGGRALAAGRRRAAPRGASARARGALAPARRRPRLVRAHVLPSRRGRAAQRRRCHLR